MLMILFQGLSLSSGSVFGPLELLCGISMKQATSVKAPSLACAEGYHVLLVGAFRGANS